MEENKERNIVWKPQPRQLEFMRRPEPEALYGGAAGGGGRGRCSQQCLELVQGAFGQCGAAFGGVRL